jgi:hypothetical protein
MTKKRTTPRQPNLSIYLGSREERQRRLNSLDAIAEAYGISRSAFIQKLADGEFVISLKDEEGPGYPVTAEDWELAEKEADKDLAAGNYKDFDTMEAFLADLMNGDDE